MSTNATADAAKDKSIPTGAGDGPILKTSSLRKHFISSSGGMRAALKAVDGVDFSVGADKVFSIVGESGSGKSTVARLLLRLLEPTSGLVSFKGRDVFGLRGAEIKSFRRAVQIIFQDPFASLNPRRTVYETIAEPLIIHGLAHRRELKDKVAELVGRVGLSDIMNRYPHEFSGGQRQRICIARALAVSPEIIVADEPLSALDVSIQAQILNLLMELRVSTGISFVFISHDLRVVQYISDEVGVMYLGKIVEQAPSETLFGEPLHPYTVMLLSSAPGLIPGAARKVQVPLGEVPSPLNIPPGCPFHPRCPHRFKPCDNIVPQLLEHKGRLVSCHLYGAE